MIDDLVAAALRANLGRVRHGAAQVAAQFVLRAVIGHRRRAMVAFLDEAAAQAPHGRVIAAPVEEKDRLFALFAAVLHRFDEETRKRRRGLSADEFAAHVDEMDGG